MQQPATPLQRDDAHPFHHTPHDRRGYAAVGDNLVRVLITSPWAGGSIFAPQIGDPSPKGPQNPARLGLGQFNA
jgi:hypothetical protein